MVPRSTSRGAGPAIMRPAAALVLVVACVGSSWAAAPPDNTLVGSKRWTERQACRALYDSRREMTAEEIATVSSRLPASRMHCPALLWTYTGTGNTMTRMLIEVTSGWYTGSVYTDLSLVDVLPGEYLCGPSVIAVKAHPQWHPFSSLSPEGIRPAVPNEPPDAKDICPCDFSRAVAVIRDPFSTFLAEYKRLRTHDYGSCSHAEVEGRVCQGGHVSVITKNEFDAADFRREVLRMAHEWADMFESYDAFQAVHPQGFYLTTFENLTQQATKTQALGDLLAALGVPPAAGPTLRFTNQSASTQGNHEAHEQQEATDDGDTDAAHAALHDTAQQLDDTAPQQQQPADYDPERLACAFEMARHPSILRPKEPAGIDAGFVYWADAGLVCDIWRLVGARAQQHGYQVYGGISC